MADEVVDRPLNQADAKNRALRTFVVGLAIDVAVAVSVVLITIFADVGSWGEIQWAIIGFTLLKTVLTTIASYILRRFVDKPGSLLLPPNPPGQPSERTADQLQPRRDPQA
jgi:hypothetical protein